MLHINFLSFLFDLMWSTPIIFVHFLVLYQMKRCRWHYFALKDYLVGIGVYSYWKKYGSSAPTFWLLFIIPFKLIFLYINLIHLHTWVWPSSLWSWWESWGLSFKQWRQKHQVISSHFPGTCCWWVLVEVCKSWSGHHKVTIIKKKKKENKEKRIHLFDLQKCLV